MSRLIFSVFLVTGSLTLAAAQAPSVVPTPNDPTPVVAPAAPPAAPAPAAAPRKAAAPKKPAAKKDEEEETTTPWYLRWMIMDTKEGMVVKLPIIDTDPNRGSTAGFMPIWIIKKPGTDQVGQIHAPSIAFNKVFGPVPTYRYYLYPTDVSYLHMRIAGSNQIEKEALIEYEDEDLFSKDIALAARIQYNVDGGRRFFGIGPSTPKKRSVVRTPNTPYDISYVRGTGETNYAEDYFRMKIDAGFPLVPKSHWKIHPYNDFLAWKTWNGMIPNLPAWFDTYPGVGPKYRQQTNLMGLKMVYDTRDHPVTPSRGEYLKLYAETSIKGFLGIHDFQRYGVDARIIYPYDLETGNAIALQVKFDQSMANAPFWFQPSIGGKQSLRAYAEGRFIDRGAMIVRAEHRINVYSVELAGVTTTFEFAPFTGLGTVFHGPEDMATRYMRPVYGLGFRAVARPQVVGSVDFGVGQEGMAAFVDINYAF